MNVILNMNSKRDLGVNFGEDIDRKINEMVGGLEHRERMVKLNKHFLGFMKGRFVNYRYFKKTKMFMVKDCGWNGHKVIGEKNGKMVIQGFLNKINKKRWDEWVDYKYSKKMLGCESIELERYEISMCKKGRINDDFLKDILEEDMSW